MRAAGLKVSEIAAALGITTQMVYKHLAKLQAAGERPKEAAS